VGVKCSAKEKKYPLIGESARSDGKSHLHQGKKKEKGEN